MQVIQYSRAGIVAAAVHDDAAPFFTKKKNHFKVENRVSLLYSFIYFISIYPI